MLEQFLLTVFSFWLTAFILGFFWVLEDWNY